MKITYNILIFLIFRSFFLDLLVYLILFEILFCDVICLNSITRKNLSESVDLSDEEIFLFKDDLNFCVLIILNLLRYW